MAIFRRFVLLLNEGNEAVDLEVMDTDIRLDARNDSSLVRIPLCVDDGASVDDTVYGLVSSFALSSSSSMSLRWT